MAGNDAVNRAINSIPQPFLQLTCSQLNGVTVDQVPSQVTLQRCSNEAYKKLLANDAPEPGFTTGKFAHESIVGGKKAAYIINSMVSYRELKNLPTVIKAILEGLDSDTIRARVAIVVGVNAPSTLSKVLSKSVEDCKPTIDSLTEVPVSVVKLEWTGTTKSAFPYGTIRNRLIDSEPTRALTRHYSAEGLHPYISFQDFDYGSRRVKTDGGPHIFSEIDKILEGGDPYRPSSGPLDHEGESDMLVAESREPIRPLMIAGGYRPYESSALLETLGKKSRRGKKRKVEEEVKRTDPMGKFREVIAHDMSVRDMLARMHPLLPYSPEPNLFVDAMALYRHGSNHEPPRFGPDGTEWLKLRTALAMLNSTELETYYKELEARRLKDSSEIVEDVKKSTPNSERSQSGPAMYFAGGSEPTEEFADDNKLFALAKMMTSPISPGQKREQAIHDEVGAELAMSVHLNRHPQRGQSFYADFSGLTIATDLPKLAKSFVSKAKVSQTNDLGSTATRLMATRQDKSGLELARVRNDYVQNASSLEIDGPVEVDFAKAFTGETFLDYPTAMLGGHPDQEWNKAFNSSVLSNSEDEASSSDSRGRLEQMAFAYTLATAYGRDEATTKLADQKSSIQEGKPVEGHPEISLIARRVAPMDFSCGPTALCAAQGIELKDLNAMLRMSKAGVLVADKIAFGGWLTQDDIILALGLMNSSVAVVTLVSGVWRLIYGDVDHSKVSIGSLPIYPQGPREHWVTLERAD